MNKGLMELALFFILFFGFWGALGELPLTKVFLVDEIKAETELQIGEIIRESIQTQEKVIEDSLIIATVDSMKQRICRNNGIQGDSIEVLVIEEGEENAFALPGKFLILHTGMISNCETPEELLSVMAHEIAHIEQGHVMKKLLKEVGSTVLLSMLGGDNGRVVKQVAGTLSSSAYDRELEREADRIAVTYLENARVDPEHFANVMLRFSKKTKDIPDSFYWISTHPESKERAGEILRLKNKSVKNYQPVMSMDEWQQIQAILE